MLFALLLAARLPAPPPAIAEVTLSDPTGSVTVQLRRVDCWSDRALAEDGAPAAHQDPLHTGLVPKLEKRKGTTTCLWTGYRPGTHEAPGDTLLTYALLVAQTGTALSGLWYEDHREVPRTYYRAVGAQLGTALSLALTDPDGGPPATLSGVVATP